MLQQRVDIVMITDVRRRELSGCWPQYRHRPLFLLHRQRPGNVQHGKAAMQVRAGDLHFVREANAFLKTFPFLSVSEFMCVSESIVKAHHILENYVPELRLIDEMSEYKWYLPVLPPQLEQQLHVCRIRIVVVQNKCKVGKQHRPDVVDVIVWHHQHRGSVVIQFSPIRDRKVMIRDHDVIVGLEDALRILRPVQQREHLVPIDAQGDVELPRIAVRI